MNLFDIEAVLPTQQPPPGGFDIESSPLDRPQTERATASAEEAPTVGAVFAGLVRHPFQHLVGRWNWKSALLSSLLRATIFFFTNLISGWHAALGAMLAELVLRGATSGFYGAITESFSAARPAWAATAAAMVALPCLAHSLEFLVHSLHGTPRLGLSIGTSVVFTAFSTAFNLYAMRRGVLVTSRKNNSLLHDLTQVPPLLLSFVLTGPQEMARCLNRVVLAATRASRGRRIEG